MWQDGFRWLGMFPGRMLWERRDMMNDPSVLDDVESPVETEPMAPVEVFACWLDAVDDGALDDRVYAERCFLEEGLNPWEL